jgi:hypothetical protein
MSCGLEIKCNFSACGGRTSQDKDYDAGKEQRCILFHRASSEFYILAKYNRIFHDVKIASKKLNVLP